LPTPLNVVRNAHAFCLLKNGSGKIRAYSSFERITFSLPPSHPPEIEFVAERRSLPVSCVQPRPTALLTVSACKSLAGKPVREGGRTNEYSVSVRERL